jgi:hypothetical protein
MPGEATSHDEALLPRESPHEAEIRYRLGRLLASARSNQRTSSTTSRSSSATSHSRICCPLTPYTAWCSTYQDRSWSSACTGDAISRC